MVKEFMKIIIMQNMKEIGSKINNMVMVQKVGQMDQFLKVFDTSKYFVRKLQIRKKGWFW